MVKILFLTANPRDRTQLSLYQEIFEVSSEVHQADFGVQFEFLPHVSVKWRDITQLLRVHKPDILHFSGHGSDAAELIFEDEHGDSQSMDEKSIRTVFRLLKDNIRCVVLNACYAESQANEIAEHIDCVVGTSNEVDDQEAIDFSREFYRQLANGRSVLDAYELGCTHVAGGKQRVKLIHPKTDASKIIFVQNVPSSTAQVGPINREENKLLEHTPKRNNGSSLTPIGLVWPLIGGVIVALTIGALGGYYTGGAAKEREISATQTAEIRITTQTPEPMSETTVAGPPATAMYQGYLHVFAQSGDGRMIHWWLDATRNDWQGPAPFNPLAGTKVAGPPATAMYQGHPHVFAQSDDGRMIHWWLDATRNDWQGPAPFDPPAGTKVAGSPATVTYEGYPHVFAQSGDGRMVHWWLDATRNDWQGPEASNPPP